MEFMKKLGWKERQKVILSLKGKKITIEDWKKQEELLVISFSEQQ